MSVLLGAMLLLCGVLGALGAIHSSWRYVLVGFLAVIGTGFFLLVLYYAVFVGGSLTPGVAVTMLAALVPVASYSVGLYRYGPHLRPWAAGLVREAAGPPAASVNLLDTVLGRNAVIDSVSADGVIRLRLVGWRARALVTYRLGQIALFLAVIIWHDQLLEAFGNALGGYLRGRLLGR